MRPNCLCQECPTVLKAGAKFDYVKGAKLDFEKGQHAKTSGEDYWQMRKLGQKNLEKTKGFRYVTELIQSRIA